MFQESKSAYSYDTEEDMYNALQDVEFTTNLHISDQFYIRENSHVFWWDDTQVIQYTDTLVNLDDYYNKTITRFTLNRRKQVVEAQDDDYIDQDTLEFNKEQRGKKCQEIDDGNAYTDIVIGWQNLKQEDPTEDTKILTCMLAKNNGLVTAKAIFDVWKIGIDSGLGFVGATAGATAACAAVVDIRQFSLKDRVTALEVEVRANIVSGTAQSIGSVNEIEDSGQATYDIMAQTQNIS
ncbi:MAG: hypothetical protein EZS28_048814, partial [Streblomastix strix]